MEINIGSSILASLDKNKSYEMKKHYLITYNGCHEDFKLCKHFNLTLEKYQYILKQYNAILVHSIIQEEYYGNYRSYNSYFVNLSDCKLAVQYLTEILDSHKVANILTK